MQYQLLFLDNTVTQGCICEINYRKIWTLEENYDHRWEWCVGLSVNYICAHGWNKEVADEEASAFIL